MQVKISNKNTINFSILKWLFCGKQNILKHGHFSTVAAHFINFFTIFQIGQSIG